MKVPNALKPEVERLVAEFDATVADYINTNPRVTYPEVASKFDISETKVITIIRKHGISRKRGRKVTEVE